MKNKWMLTLQIWVGSYAACSVVLVFAWLFLPKLQGANLALLHVSAMVLSVVLAGYIHLFPFRAGMSKGRLWGKRLTALVLGYGTYVGTNALLGVLPIRPIPHAVGLVGSLGLAALWYGFLDLRERRTIAEINQKLAAQNTVSSTAEWKYNDNVKN